MKYQWYYRDIKGGGKLTFCATESFVSNFELIGFAEAKIEVRAFNVVIIPAFATEIVCCSLLLKNRI